MKKHILCGALSLWLGVFSQNKVTNPYDRLNIPELTVNKEPVVIAIIDDGFRLSHKSLKPYIYTNPNEIANNGMDDDNNGYIDDVHGWDVSDHDNDVGILPGQEDNEYHGTMISGIVTSIAARSAGENASNVIKILPVKVIKDNADNRYYKDGYAGIEYAVKMGADIICCAWSGGKVEDRYKAVFDEAAKKGITIICSAGNFFSEKIEFPGAAPSAYVVAAIDSNLRKLPFSNYGKKVDLVAFGDKVKAAHPKDDNTFFFAEGTSPAVALVTGLAAILKYAVPKAGPREIFMALKNTAVPVDSLNLRYACRLGSGLPDTQAALQYLTHPESRNAFFSFARAEGNIILDGSKNSFTIQPPGGIKNIDLKFVPGAVSKMQFSFYMGDSLFAQYHGELPENISIPGNIARIEYSGKPGKEPAMLIYEAIPIDSATLYCRETQQIMADSGAITDGSGENNYANVVSCKWQINVTEGKRIKLEFEEMDTEGNIDFVWLFHGTETLQENLLAKFSGKNIPPVIVTPFNSLLVWFVTDEKNTGKGWKMKFFETEEEQGVVGH